MHQDLNVFLMKPKRRPDYKVFLLGDNLKDLLLCHIETSCTCNNKRLVFKLQAITHESRSDQCSVEFISKHCALVASVAQWLHHFQSDRVS